MYVEYASQLLDESGSKRGHDAIHLWVYKAGLQLVSTARADQLAVDEKVIRTNGDDYWLYGAVDPDTNETCSSGSFRRQRSRRRDGFWPTSTDDVG